MRAARSRPGPVRITRELSMTDAVRHLATVAVLLGILMLAACDPGFVEDGVADADLAETVSIGVIDGDEAQIFGRIADVRAATDGSFFVLDEQAATLSWFDLQGRYRGGIRSRGSGPGELSGPRAFDVSSTGTLVVVDPRNARYSFYGFDSEGVRYDGSIPTLSVQGPGRHTCSVGDRLYIRGDLDGHLIHEFNRNGDVLRSFERSEPASRDEFGPTATMVAAQRNSGRLGCFEDPPLVVSLSMYLPYVRAYTLEGEFVWETEIADFRPMRFIAIPEGGVRFENDPDGGSHLGQVVTRWSGQTLLVQHSVLWPEGVGLEDQDRDFFALESRELSLLTGSEVGKTDDLPLLVDERDGLFYSFENLPYPRVRVLTRAN